MTDLDDRTLDLARTGDSRALRSLHDVLAPRVLGYSRGQGVEDADAVANEALYRALRDIGGFAGDARKFRSWVFTIAHNLIIDDRRRRSRRPSTVPLDRAPEGVSGGDLGDVAVTRVEARRMLRWIDELSPDQRDVLLLRLVSDLPINEVATIVGKRPGAVKALQRRGLAALRRRLDAEGVSPDASTAFTRVP